jgi:hypothetical protein
MFLDLTANGASSDVTYTGDISVTAAGDNTHAYMSVDMSAGHDVNFIGDISVTTSGDNIHHDAAETYVNLSGEDVYHTGNITVLDDSTSGVYSSAVMHLNINADYSAALIGNVDVSALGSHDHATLAINIDGNTSETGMCGEVNVTADYGVAAVSVSVTGEFMSDVSLDADHHGNAILSIVADSVDSTFHAYTNDNGEVDLSIHTTNYASDGSADFSSSDFTFGSSITESGGLGGVFNLDLQIVNSFDIGVNLHGDSGTFGGEFHLTIEDPMQYSSSDTFAGSVIQITGFDSKIAGYDTINFNGDAFRGDYVDATVQNGSVDAVDAYSNDYTDLTTFMTDANTALDGSVDYFFGTEGGNGYLAVGDSSGKGVDYVIELVGVTTMDWTAVHSAIHEQHGIPGLIG